HTTSSMLHPTTIRTLFPYTTLFRSQPELLDTPFDFSPRKSRFVAEPEIQCQAVSHSEIILGIYATEDVAVVLEFSRALTERKVADRKSTRLNSSHEWISYAVFCLKK